MKASFSSSLPETVTTKQRRSRTPGPGQKRRGPERFGSLLLIGGFAVALGAVSCQLDEGGLPGDGLLPDAGMSGTGGADGTGGLAGTGGVAGTSGSGGAVAGTGGVEMADGGTGGDGADAAADAPMAMDAPAEEITAPLCAHCDGYGTPHAIGRTPAVAKELSGLAASRLHPGILYGHNDSGDSARLFALDQTAALNTEIDLTGATNVDWEDIDMGPCPAGSCIYVGDIGDNDSIRAGYVIYRVVEPPTLPGGGANLAVSFERFPFVYPDGAHNAETLLVHPQTGRVFVVTKEKTAVSTVYELPLPLQADTMVTLVKVGMLSVPAAAGPVTGGAFHPCGDRILIRSKTTLAELTRPAGGELVSVFFAPPVAVPFPVEPQGEAVDYSPDGLGYYTGSEIGSASVEPDISYVACH